MIVLRVVTIFALLTGIAGYSVPMPFTTIARGDHSQIQRPREVVVRTAGEWAALWKEHAGGTNPPAVDFTRSMVVGVFAGSRPTAGYRVEITGIEKQDDGLVVTYRAQAPPPDAMVAQLLTSPFHIVRTELQTGHVTFSRTH